MLLRSSTDEVRVVRGREEVLQLSRSLTDLCLQCDQPGALDDLEYNFSRPGFRSRQPTMVVVETRSPFGRVPAAAVLAYQYQLLGISTGVYAADFLGGASGIIAPRRMRARAAFAASEALLGRGGLLTHFSYEGEDSAEDLSYLGGSGHRWATRTRSSASYLPIDPDLEATYGLLGRRTRRNLRYYRRLAESELGAELVVSPRFSRDEYLAFDARCDYPVPRSKATARFERLQQVPRPLFLGLQGGNGEWLSLLGGYINGYDAVVQWQLNRNDMREHSLCTAMRAFLLQHCVDEHIRRVYFIGGTTHSMGNALTREMIVDIVVARPGIPKALINRVATAADDLPGYQGLIPELVRYDSPGTAGAELKSA
jgi:hypothetical protein